VTRAVPPRLHADAHDRRNGHATHPLELDLGPLERRTLTLVAVLAGATGVLVGLGLWKLGELVAHAL
jgi:hypothetical protein